MQPKRHRSLGTKLALVLWVIVCSFHFSFCIGRSKFSNTVHRHHNVNVKNRSSVSQCLYTTAAHFPVRVNPNKDGFLPVTSKQLVYTYIPGKISNLHIMMWLSVVVTTYFNWIAVFDPLIKNRVYLVHCIHIQSMCDGWWRLEAVCAPLLVVVTSWRTRIALLVDSVYKILAVAIIW